MEEKTLKTLAQHNAERLEIEQSFRHANDPRPNGIACPRCGKELWDSCPMITLTSHPAQKNVHCPDCGHRGYRLA